MDEVHSSQPDGTSESPPLENISSEFWGHMQKGNIATCEGVFSWSSVDQVQLHDEKAVCQFNIVNYDDLRTSFAPASFAIDDLTLPVKAINVENFAPKARELVRLIAHLTRPLENDYVQLTRSYQDSSGDSDDEHVPDFAIEAAFTDTEWDSIVDSFKKLRRMYAAAARYKFENAHGKYFLQDLIKFCCSLNVEMRDYVRHGTNSYGELQPGCCQWMKNVIRAEPSRSRSSSVATLDLPSSKGVKRPNRGASQSEAAMDTPSKRTRQSVKGKRKAQEASTSSRRSKAAKASTPPYTSCPSTSSPKKNTMLIPIKTYSDVAVWNPSKLLYSISGEVKSKEKASVEEQSSNQMFGLFRNYQKASLGLILKPETIQINVLVRNGNELTLHKLNSALNRPLSIADSATFKMLCRVIIAFIFFVDH